MNISKFLLTAMVLGFVPMVTNVSAGIITFGTPTTFTGDSSIDNQGTTLYAYRYAGDGSTSLEVNGVTFTTVAADFTNTGVNSTGVDYGIPSGHSANPSDLTVDPTAADSPTADLSSEMQDLLLNAFYVFPYPGTLTLTLSGLTQGEEYAFQLGTTDPRAALSDRADFISDPANPANVVTLKFNSTGVDGGLGQYLIGTFAATSSTETINLDSNAVLQISFLQVRDLGAAPEPSTWALMVAGMGVLLFRLRRRTCGR